jgi:2-iminobutanoate/2-iminopropanoate deaminase
MRQAIITDKAPAPAGPYSQAIIAKGFIFVSGQIGIDPKSGALANGISAQAHQAFENLKAILAAADAMPSDVVKTELLLADMKDFAAVNEPYAEFFSSEPFPARQASESPHLPKGALIEISCIAAANDHQ